MFLLGGEANNTDAVCEEVKDDTGSSVRTCKNSAVFPSLPLAIKWLRDSVYQNRSVRIQVMLINASALYNLRYKNLFSENIVEVDSSY